MLKQSRVQTITLYGSVDPNQRAAVWAYISAHAEHELAVGVLAVYLSVSRLEDKNIARVDDGYMLLARRQNKRVRVIGGTRAKYFSGTSSYPKRNGK